MRIVFLFFVCLFSKTIAFAQADNKVSAIREVVEQINKDTVYQKRTLDNEQFLEQMTDGGGQLTGYFKNKQLVKIVEWVGLSSCISLYEYYLQNGLLIFAYGQEKVFPYDNHTGLFDYQKQILGMECRFYFDKGKLINSKFNGQTRCAFAPSDSQAPDLLASCKRYSSLLEK